MSNNYDSLAITLQGVKKQFGDFAAVDDVTFDVPRGSIFGFIGPSGSGKTTTVRMLTGVYAPTAGKISVLGSNPKKFSREIRARLGYMPQHFVLYPNLTIGENLSFAASLYGMGMFRGRKLNKILNLVELNDHERTLAQNASGGMQRRLSLAATLVHDPELIFLDEPTAGIDPLLRRKFWDHFHELQSQGRTMFITTQYVSEAAYCDLIGVMSEGKLLAVDTPKGLRHRAFGGDVVDLVTTSPLDWGLEQSLRDLPFVRRVTRTGMNELRLVVEDASTAVPDLVQWTNSQNLEIKTVDEYAPPFEDVFVELVKTEAENA